MPNSDWTDKLNTFKALVLSDAQEKRAEIMHETQTHYDECMDKKETELLERAYTSIQKNIREAQNDAHGRVMNAELAAKKKLAKRREEIVEDVMNSAHEELVRFVNSNEYEKWLVGKAKAAADELGEGKKNIYVADTDMKFKDKLISAVDNAEITETCERGFLGGVRVENIDRRIAADYSLGALLDEQRQLFLRESGLGVD